jgi:hypothetical protein
MGESSYQVKSMHVEAFYRVITKPVIIHTAPFCLGMGPRQNQEIKVPVGTLVVCLAVRRIPGSRYAHRVDPWAHKLKVLSSINQPWLNQVGWLIGSETNMIDKSGMTELDRSLLMQVLSWDSWFELVR